MPPVVQLVPPLSDVPWSADFVAQSLETLFVCLRAGGASHLRPIHAPTLRLGWAPGPDPGEIVLDASTRHALTPLLVHSTSWRHEGDRLEHAFRHLSWLVNDDAVVGEALSDRVRFLDRYEPEPFRAFGA
jgi:hypothetical protein